MGIESEGKNKENKGREETSNKAHNERFSHDSLTVLLLFYVRRNVERIIVSHFCCRYKIISDTQDYPGARFRPHRRSFYPNAIFNLDDLMEQL